MLQASNDVDHKITHTEYSKMSLPEKIQADKTHPFICVYCKSHFTWQSKPCDCQKLEPV